MDKKKQINLLNKKIKIITWIKKLSILYNLLIFSKKRLKYNFIRTIYPSDLFFILLLPLLGYTLDKKFFLYNTSNSEFFFKNTLPGLNNFNLIISSNLNWETFNYTEYFKKINWNKLKKINYFDNSIFVCFNSNLYNKNFYIGIQLKNKKYINSNKLLKIITENKINKKNIFLFNKNIKNIKQNKQLNKYFISGRFFNQFFKPYIYNKKNNNILYKYNLNNLIFNNKNLKTNYFIKLRNWQNFFYKLDYIPLKLDNIFFFNNTNFNIDPKNKLLNKPLFNNLFLYSNKNKFSNYELKKKKIIKFSNFETIIEKQNKRLNYEMFNKQISYNLWNFRFFQYKIYNKLYLLNYFLNNQIHNFNYNKKNLINIYDLLLKKNNFINKYEKKSLEKNNIFLKFIENQKEPNWKNLLRKDLKNLGNTRNEKFFNLDKIKNQSTNFIDFQDYNLNFLNINNKSKNNNLFFFKNTIKIPISLDNRENKNILTKISDNKKNLKNNKLYDFNINNKKYSFIPSIERELFYYLKFLIKKKKSLDLKTYSDKIIFFVFKNYNFINFSEKNVNEKKYFLKKYLSLKDRIIEGDSDLLKRKMSGYLYPDNKKTNLLFINKCSLFNNSFIKIQGQKNLIYKDFKKFYNNLFFLYNEKTLIDYNLEQTNYKNKYFYLKNKNNLIKNKFFFGNSLMDFGLAFNYDKNLNLKTKKENDKINYKPNLNLIYNKRRLDTKIPFAYEYPIKDELLINYNYYYNSLVFNKKNFFIFSFNKDKLLDRFLINKYNSNNFNLNKNKLLEINDYNEISVFPISYKSHFEYNKNYDLLNISYSTFIKNFKNIFNADLYETITLKQFSLLIQFIFLLIFLKLINNLKENYGQSFLIAFKTFFNNFEFDALTNLKIEVGKTIKSKKIKFNNLIGGKIFLQEFNQTILLLKNSKYGLQSNLNIIKPEFKFELSIRNNKFNLYSKNKNYNNSFFNITNKQKNFIYNFIYNPFNIILLNYNVIKLRKTIINNQSFIINLKNTINIKGFLLVGPPGTGKTLLVKALSGESDVPIILESGEKLSKLNFQNDTMSENTKGALQLKNLFNRAKKLSPCILFLDEIDNIGQNRKDVLIDYHKQNLKNYSITNSLYFLSNNKVNISLLNLNKLNINHNLLLNLKNNLLLNLENTNFFNLKRKINSTNKLNTKSLSMLTQLLCELDGLKNRRDLVIIGATNRPKTLDPALTRPGRLNKIIYIDLPGKKKRFELLKFYSKNKINNNNYINWEFFTNQTTGLSAADLSSAINIALLNKIYNLKKKKLKVNKIKNKDLNKFYIIQDFKNIEYGIEIIKFKNISFKYKSYELGLLINNSILNYNYYSQLKLLNILNFSNFFLVYNKFYINNNNKKLLKKWSKTKNIKLNNVKKGLRTIFYKKNKKFIKYLYLLNKKNNIQSFFIKIKNYYILKIFYKYMNRLFKVHIFSCCILIFSTYILNNPLIFSFNFLYNFLKFKINIKYNYIKHNKFILTLNNNFILFKYNNILKYKLICYNFTLTNNISFFTNKKFYYTNNKIFSINQKFYYKNNNNLNTPNLKLKKNKKFKINNNIFNKYYKTIYKKQINIQKLLLNDSIFINRSCYYLGGKALVLNILKKSIKNLNYFSLWLIKNRFEKNKIKKDIFIKTFSKTLINKEEFENYLLFIISGKISEIKFLFNNNLDNFSNIAINDLKEIGWLLNIMINKHYFYKTLKLKLFKQIIIQDLTNSIQINNKKIFKHKNNNNIKFEHKLILLKNKFNKDFLFNKKKFINLNNQKFIFWDLIPYWWEPNLKIKKFTIYWSFSKSKQFNLSTLLYKNSFKYKYYYTLINNKVKISKNKNLKSNEIIYLNKTFNINFLNNFFKSKINWNSFLLIEYYILMSNIIFSLTNKIFNLLHTNNELLDYFCYYILCNESFYDFELNKIYLNYYKKY